MEATFYHDDAGDRGSANTLKRKMTLDFDSAPKRSKQQKLSSVLQSPDLNMLKLASPELERMIIQANGMITTPTPTQFIFPKFVTEEQEAYARGFVDALAELKADEGSPTGAGMEFVSNPSISYKYLTTSDGLRAITTASSLRSLHGGIINPTNRARTLVKSEAPQLSRPSVSPLPTMIDLKEEPQTVPCLSSTPPPLSPINMESQETLKLERKRARNRVAARKCRTRKLERISRLEDRVNGLKDNNTDLSETASSLKEQVFKLKQQIVDHHEVMGISYASIQDKITVVSKFTPKYPYVPFPAHRKKEPGGLIAEFKALPPNICDADDSTDNYWWTDCQFLSYDDSLMYVTATPYHIRLAHSWLLVKGMPHGKICRYSFNKEQLRCEILPTSCKAYPKVQPHPDGNQFAHVGDGEIVVKMDNQKFRNTYRLPKDFRTSLYRYCAISPSGYYLAVIARVHGTYELQIHSMDYKLSELGTVVCHRICPGFVATPRYNEHVECKWSPDSKYLAVGSSLGVIFILNCSDFTNVCDVFQDIIEDCGLSTVQSCDFDPRFGHHVFTVGATDKSFYAVDIVRKKILKKSDVTSRSSCIDCVQYSADGIAIAVAFSDFSIKLFDTVEGNLTFSIHVKDISSTIRQPSAGAYPAVIRLCFTKSGEELSVCSSDGYVRIWQLPRQLDLQHICKMKILALIPVNSLKKLQIPTQLLHYLLDYPK